MNLTSVDFVVIAVVAISTIFAVLRGFVSEALSIAAWAAAGLAALYFGHYGVALLVPLVKTGWLARLLGYAGVFLIVLIPLLIASARVSERVRESAVGPVDRLLGAAFGIARGLIIVGGLYILFGLFVPLRDQPASLKSARLLPVIQGSAQALVALAPAEYRPVPHAESLSAGLADPGGQPSHNHASKTYGAADRRALDKLIGATDSSKGR